MSVVTKQQNKFNAQSNDTSPDLAPPRGKSCAITMPPHICVQMSTVKKRTQFTVSFRVICQHGTVERTTHGRQSAFVLQRLARRSWRLSCVLCVEVNRPLSELSNHEEGGHCRCLCVCTAPSAYSSRVQSAENAILQPVIQRYPAAMKYSRGEERVCVDCIGRR